VQARPPFAHNSPEAPFGVQEMFAFKKAISCYKETVDLKNNISFNKTCFA
jgi:hypothetical protein